MSEQDEKEAVLAEFEPEKRELLQKIALTAAFTVPAVASSSWAA